MKKYRIFSKNLSCPQFFMIFRTSCRNLALIGAKLRERFLKPILAYLNAYNSSVRRALNRYRCYSRFLDSFFSNFLLFIRQRISNLTRIFFFSLIEYSINTLRKKKYNASLVPHFFFILYYIAINNKFFFEIIYSFLFNYYTII